MLKSAISAKPVRAVHLNYKALGLLLSVVMMSLSLAACGSDSTPSQTRTLDVTVAPSGASPSASDNDTAASTTGAAATGPVLTSAPATVAPPTVTPLPATSTAPIAGQTTAAATTA